MAGDRMRVKEAPRRIEGLPVVKSIFLGWLSSLRQEAGYFSYALTYGVTDLDKGAQYQGHLMWADGLDKPWRRIQSSLGMERHAAKAAFADYEKLAEWPEGS